MPKSPRDHDANPVSLAPLDPEEALRALLAVKPDDNVDDQQETASDMKETDDQ